MTRPRITLLRTWENHERRVLDILIEALAILRRNCTREPNEVLQNRALYRYLMEANNNQWRRGTGGFDHPPVPDGKNLPSADDKSRAEREDKVPDFQWTLIDHAEPDPMRSAHAFVIECKLLGIPKRSDWVYNENYVRHGILRFIREEHGYAKSEISGAMVGYVYDMDLTDILAQVNATAAVYGISCISAPLSGWQDKQTSLLVHTLVRSFAFSPFKLHHFWVDLRAPEINTATMPPAENLSDRIGIQDSHHADAIVRDNDDSSQHGLGKKNGRRRKKSVRSEIH